MAPVLGPNGPSSHRAKECLSMGPVTVDPKNVHEFADEQSFYAWLARHHAKKDDVWIKIHKVSSGLASVTPKQAIDVALCWGWIDGLRKGLDATSYLQRYTPRRSQECVEQDQRRQRGPTDPGRPDD